MLDSNFLDSFVTIRAGFKNLTKNDFAGLDDDELEDLRFLTELLDTRIHEVLRQLGNRGDDS